MRVWMLPKFSCYTHCYSWGVFSLFTRTEKLNGNSYHTKTHLSPATDWKGFILPVPLSDFKWMWFHSPSHLILEHLNLQRDLIFKWCARISRGLFQGGKIAPLKRKLMAGKQAYLSPVIQQIFTACWAQILGVSRTEGARHPQSHTAKLEAKHLGVFFPLTGATYFPSPWGDTQSGWNKNLYLGSARM